MSDVDVRVDASTDGLTAGMRQAAATVQGGIGEIRGHLDSLNGMFGKLTAGFAAFTAALAGGAALKSFVAESMNLTKEAMSLAKVLGITATEASYMNAALDNVGLSGDVVKTAAGKIGITLLKNEDAFKKLGVATRDSNGHFRSTGEIMADTNDKLKNFAEGTDRNIEGMKIYSKSWSEIAPLVAKFGGVSADARAEFDELNLVVGQEAVDNLKRYKAATNDVNDVMSGIKNTIGSEIIPRLAELGEWFRSIGPAAIKVVRIAMQGYLTLQDALKDSARALWNVVVTAAQAIGRIISAIFGTGGSALTSMQFFENCVKVVQIAFIAFRIAIEEACAMIEGGIDHMCIVFQTLGRVAQAALKFDWTGVKTAMDAGTKAVTDNFNGMTQKLVGIAIKGRADIDKVLFTDMGKSGKVTPIKAKDVSGARSSGADKTDDKNKKDKDERMKTWEADLLDQKRKYMEENDMREMSLADESAYWKKILSTLKDGDSQKSAVRKKASEVDFAEAKRQAKVRLDLAVESIDQEQKIALGAVDADQEAANQRLQLNLATQAQTLQAEQAFENARYAIQEKALRARLELLAKDPEHNAVEMKKLMDQILVLEQKHANDVQKIYNKQALEAKKPYLDLNNSIQGNFKKTIAGLMDGTLSFGGAVRSLFKGVLSSVVEMMSEMAAKWIMTLLSGRIMQATTAVAQVMSNAAVAASAAFASTAAIPIIGPGLAPGASMAAYAGAASYAPLASARNGFDIPAGLNPVTQLHEREMVLPQAQADAVRDMADGKGGGSGSMTLHIHAVDGKSVERLFRDNGRALTGALQDQVRKFAVKGRA